MPTIDDLPSAVAAADTDELPVSQAGTVRKVSRAQLLATAQSMLAVPQASLLGRVSAGTGAPEMIAIGANLALNGATLLATAAPYSVTDLPAGQAPSASDLVALSQSGGDATVSYTQFMSAIATLPGIDAGAMVATASGTTAARPLESILADAVAVEAFGAVGDGTNDDTAAFASALSAGRPVRLGPKTYVVNGQFTVGQSAALIGNPGQSVIRRAEQASGGSWFSVQGSTFVAHGITFDCNSAITADGWGVLVTAASTATQFTSCVFCNSSGPNLGHGIAFLASDPAITQHVLQDCESYGNAVNGVWVQAVSGALIVNCRSHDNGAYGICLDYTDPSFVQKVRLGQIVGNRAWSNQRGISVGNFNATNTNPPVWGNANPDAIAILVGSNICHDNAEYGIAAAGLGISVQGNVLDGNGTTANGGAGILANVASSRVCANLIISAAQFGIDAGGSIDTDISLNHVSGAAVGINPGGSQRMRISRNFIENCGWGMIIYNVETDGAGRNFGQSTQGVDITDNWITIPDSSGGGIYLLDAPQGVLVARNSFFGLGAAASSQALWAHTDTVIVAGNRWNNQQRFICNPSQIASIQQVQFPDMIDDLMITAAPAGVQSMLGEHQAAMQGQIAYVKVTNSGVGYSQAEVAIQGVGTGAVAIAYLANGSVIGVSVTNAGLGYGQQGATASVSISGDGTGATAEAAVGLPVPEERRLRVACNTAVLFTRAGSVPFQDNWTLFDVTVPAGTEVEWVGTWGGWRGAQFPASDYVAPPGDGSLELRTVAGGDLVLRPSAGGRVRIASDSEVTGAMACIGRGSPLGVVAAPPGSDYRNLGGGAGNTFWVKQTGTDSLGWVAIA